MTYSTILSIDALKPMMGRGDILVFDCSFDLDDPDAGELAYRAGHIPGAHYLHLDRQLSGSTTGRNGRHPLPSPESFAQTMRDMGLRAGQQVVAYDAQGGFYAARLWWLLHWLGHEAVAVLDGGLPAWNAAGGVLETGDAVVAKPGNFTAKAPDPTAIEDTAALLANIENPTLLVVDARTAERFAGAPHPLDPVAGHIPGAVNRFFKNNLDATGLFKTRETLAVEWRSLLGKMSARQAVMQCGSGVTACHNLLALAIAGLDGAKLYPGSWSEWVVDPTRPVARGG